MLVDLLDDIYEGIAARPDRGAVNYSRRSGAKKGAQVHCRRGARKRRALGSERALEEEALRVRAGPGKYCGGGRKVAGKTWRVKIIKTS